MNLEQDAKQNNWNMKLPLFVLLTLESTNLLIAIQSQTLAPPIRVQTVEPAPMSMALPASVRTGGLDRSVKHVNITSIR